MRLKRYEYGGIIITLFPTAFDVPPRLCEGGFQIDVQGDYRDQDSFSARLLPNNEILLLMPSISSKWLDSISYAQITANCDTGELGHSQAMNAHTIMRSTYLKEGNEALLIRAVVFSFPDHFPVSNEVFSSAAFLKTDPRSKMIMHPCNTSYNHKGWDVHETFFRAYWRFNKQINEPLLTTVAQNHNAESLNKLNEDFQRMMHLSSR